MILPDKLQTEIKGLLGMDVSELSKTELRYYMEELVDKTKYDMVDYIIDEDFTDNIAVIDKPELSYLNRVQTTYSLFMEELVNELDKSK